MLPADNTVPVNMASYHLRPGRFSDLSITSHIWTKAFTVDPIMTYMFPNRLEDPRGLDTWISRKFQTRWWTPGWIFTVVEEKDEAGSARVVGFSWWQRPYASLSFRERWLSPRRSPSPFKQESSLTLIVAWISPLANLVITICDKLFPVRTPYPDRLGIFARTFDSLMPPLLNTQRRREAWYLASLGVDPALQSKGLGGMVLKDGLQKVDEADSGAWLVALKGLDAYYGRFGFVEVARANVGELEIWEGGSIMFRND